MKRVATSAAVVLVAATGFGLSSGCSSSYKSSGGDPQARAQVKPELEHNAQTAIDAFKQKDPSMTKFFNSAYGYAVFPTIAKGGLILGGAYGDGVVYQQGTVVGYTDLAQGTIGGQIGGQAYSEIIFFATKAALDNFKSGQFELAAQVSAVAAQAGASKNADYANGVAVFTLAKGGLMAEASVGGQKFSYQPK